MFNSHYVASVPFVLEEQCRLGAALWQFGTRLAHEFGRPANVYTLGDAAGVTARALAQVGNGLIRTLTCSPTAANQRQFYDCGAPKDAHFFLGPFFDVTPQSLRQAGLPFFQEGFDILIEDTTFQMYGPERYEQIALARRNLADDGIFILIEKIHCPDEDEYLRREHQKDSDFKMRYFSGNQVKEKRATILDTMAMMEVSLDTLALALKRHFSTAVITWNSGNFYTIAASNNSSRLNQFVNFMIPPAIPREYLYEDLPRSLLEHDTAAYGFRICSSELAEGLATGNTL